MKLTADEDGSEEESIFDYHEDPSEDSQADCNFRPSHAVPSTATAPRRSGRVSNFIHD